MSKALEPAFPDPMRGAESSVINQSPHELHTGMSIRTYLAGQAMIGLLANPNFDPMGSMIPIAEQAVLSADELIAQLEKTDK